MTPSTPSPSADAAYLRRLLERQPACLIRVRLDGVLLACSDAALSLFGVGSLGAILNTNLTDRLTAPERSKWQEFSARVWANGAASLECHLVAPDDEARPVLLQGIALNDHPDGIDSLLLNLRDQSHTHRLEHSIQSAEINRVDQEERQRAARDRIEEASAERQRLAALAEKDQAECQRLTDALAAQTADHQRREAKFVELEKRVEESQLASLGKDREHRARIAALEAALAAAQAAQATAASARDRHPAPTGQQEPASGERNRQELADLELRLRASTTEQARLRALLGDHEVRREQIAAEHQAVVDTLEQSLAAAAEEAAVSRDQARQTLADLRSQLAEAFAEQSRLAARVEEHEGERDRMTVEHHRAIADLETSKREALAKLRSQLSQAIAEQGRLAVGADEEHERERDRMTAEHQQAIADLETSKREALAELRSQLSQTLGERTRLAAQAEEEHERERDRMTAEHQRAIADLETSKREALAKLRSQLAQTVGERTRLAARVEEHERERELMAIEQDGAIAEMETSKREALAELRSQLSQTSSAEQGRLTARIEELERERDRMSAEHRRAIADLETSKGEALNECERLLTEIQQALLIRDGSGAELQRRLIKGIDEAARQKAHRERLEGLQEELKEAVSQMQAVLASDAPLQERPAAEDGGNPETAKRTQNSFWGHS